MAKHQVSPQGAKLAALDPIWDRVRSEAEDIVRREPELASFIYSTVLHHERLEDSVVHRIAERLDHHSFLRTDAKSEQDPKENQIRRSYDPVRHCQRSQGHAFEGGRCRAGE